MFKFLLTIHIIGAIGTGLAILNSLFALYKNKVSYLMPLALSLGVG